MKNKIDFPVKLEKPVDFGWMGWYIGSVNQAKEHPGMYYYLHDDGNVYEGCDSYNGHSGWFKNEAAAIIVLTYYNGTENIESQTMDFK